MSNDLSWQIKCDQHKIWGLLHTRKRQFQAKDDKKQEWMKYQINIEKWDIYVKTYAKSSSVLWLHTKYHAMLKNMEWVLQV